MKSKVWSSNDVLFMAETITDRKTLDENSSDMKTKMELLIMRIQVNDWSVSLFRQNPFNTF